MNDWFAFARCNSKNGVPRVPGVPALQPVVAQSNSKNGVPSVPGVPAPVDAYPAILYAGTPEWNTPEHQVFQVFQQKGADAGGTPGTPERDEVFHKGNPPKTALHADSPNPGTPGTPGTPRSDNGLIPAAILSDETDLFLYLSESMSAGGPHLRLFRLWPKIRSFVRRQLPREQFSLLEQIYQWMSEHGRKDGDDERI